MVGVRVCYCGTEDGVCFVGVDKRAVGGRFVDGVWGGMLPIVEHGGGRVQGR